MKVIKSILLAIFAAFIVYLMGAFHSANFNIATWTLECRFTVVYLMACVSIGILVLIYLNPKTD